MRKTLYLSGTINLTLGLINLMSTPIYALILFIIGVFNFLFASYSDIRQQSSKTIILLLSILNLFFNPLSSLISIIGCIKLNKENIVINDSRQRKKKELNKLDSFLKLGVALVSLSGIIFATTNWSIISSLLKIFLLFGFSMFFIVLSIITEKKLQLIESSKGYWFLGMLFLVFTVVGLLYFDFFNIKSDWFILSIISLVVSMLSFITYKKYDKLIYKNITFIGIILMTTSTLLGIGVSMCLSLILITSLLICLNIIKPCELTKYLSYSLALVSFINVEDVMVLEYGLLVIVSILNLFVVVRDENDSFAIVTTCLINLLIFKLITLISSYELSIIISLVFYSILYLINIVNINNKLYTKLMKLVINVAFFIIVINSLSDNVLLLLTTGTVMLTSLINYDMKYENILLPIKATTFILAIMYVMSSYFSDVLLKLFLASLYIVLFVIHNKISNKNMKLIALIMYYILFFVSLLTNHGNILISIINVLSVVIIYFIVKKKENKKNCVIAYISILYTAFSLIVNDCLFTNLSIVNCLLLLFIYILLTILNFNDVLLKKINCFSITLPLYLIMQEFDQFTELNEVFYSILGMYIVVLLNLYFFKEEKDKQFFTVLASVVFLRNLLFINSWIIGLYIGIVALVFIIYGFIKKEYKVLYIEGIVLTIINIVYQFDYLWKEVPLWIYLLFSGLIIIGIVTYKELKEKKK